VARRLHLCGQQEVTTMLPSTAAIPIDMLLRFLEPAALFAAWGVVVVGALAVVSTLLARDGRGGGAIGAGESGR
jgi:hypothetical protein